MSISLEIKKLIIQSTFKNALEKDGKDAEYNLTGLQALTKHLLVNSVQRQDQVMSKESRSLVSVYGPLSVVFNESCTVHAWNGIGAGIYKKHCVPQISLYSKKGRPRSHLELKKERQILPLQTVTSHSASLRVCVRVQSCLTLLWPRGL